MYELLAGFQGRLREVQGRDAWRRAPPDLSEYDFYLRGYRYFFNFTQEDNARVREIWQQGLAAFPRSALLRNKIAWTYVTDVENVWSDDRTRDIARAWALTHAAGISEDQPLLVTWLSHWIMAPLRQWHAGDFDRSVEEAEATIRLVPFDARSHGYLAFYLGNAGYLDQALEWAEWALRRDPRGPSMYPGNVSWVHYLAGRYERAMASIGVIMDFPLRRAAIFARLGRLDEARGIMAAYRKTTPRHTLAVERLFPLREPHKQAWLADLRACGMPEA